MRKIATEAHLCAMNMTPGVLLSRDELGLWDFGPTRSPAQRDSEGLDPTGQFHTRSCEVALFLKGVESVYLLSVVM